jgi:hypothetical protein
MSENDDRDRRKCTEFALIGWAADKVRLTAASATKTISTYPQYDAYILSSSKHGARM